MIDALVQFNANSKSVDDLTGLHTLVNTNFPLLSEQSDEVLRASIVLIVSALDTFIHDIIRLGMIECFMGIRTKSQKFEKFDISFINLQRISSTSILSDKVSFFDLEIREKHSVKTFQSSSNIEQALGLIGLSGIWSQLSTQDKMNMPANDIKGTLDLIVRRRNKIAHEADFDYSIGAKNPINIAIVNDSVSFIKLLTSNIMKLL